jgi:hypothetical protein
MRDLAATRDFDELMFSYGLELDDDVSDQFLPHPSCHLPAAVPVHSFAWTHGFAISQTTDEVTAARAKGLTSPPPQLKIEIPANR